MTQMDKAYAAALFALAQENHRETEVLEALKVVDQQLKDNPQYVDFLASPAIPKAERTEAIKAAFSDVLPDDVLSFLCILCQRGQIRLFSDCVSDFEWFLETAQKISTAVVTSVIPLNDAQQLKLQKKLEAITGHQVRLTYQIDPSLMGGVRVELDGSILDGTLKHRLHEVKEVMNR